MTRSCAFPLRDPASTHLMDLDDLRPSLLAEIEHFFAVYKDLEDKKVETQGFQDLGAALAIMTRLGKEQRRGSSVRMRSRSHVRWVAR